MTLYDLFRVQADKRPEADAILFENRRISYGGLFADVERVARELQALGIGVGDRVVAMAGNVPEVIAVYFAASRLGAVYVPVSATFKGREITFVLSNAEPKVVLADRERAAEMRRWVGDRSTDVIVLESLFEDRDRKAPEVRGVDVDPESGALLCYTSGTTASPKPVLHSHRSEVFNATSYAAAWDLGPGDRGVVSLPLAWVYGLSTTTAALLVSGATVVLLPRFHPAAVLDAVVQQKATALWGTMSMYTKMLEVIRDCGDYDLGALRVVLNGGEPCPPPLVKEFEGRTGAHVQGSYATSEARPIVLVRPGDRTAPEGTVGKLVEGAEIRLVGPERQVVPVGEVGHAELRCDGMMTEYYREPELTAARLTPDGWLRSGDLMRVDKDGYYYVVGRESEMIIRSGANIAPAEVEAALVTHPSVAEAAVVGVPDSRSGEAVRAVIVTVRGTNPTEDELRASLSEQLAAFKVPQEFLFVDELPRTDRGKVDRLALRTLERIER